MEDIATLISEYGFPIIAAGGMGYFVFHVWKWATEEVDPAVDEATATLVGLIDRVRMLDNDLIRLKQKVDTVLHLRGKTIEQEREQAQDKINDN